MAGLRSQSSARLSSACAVSACHQLGCVHLHWPCATLQAALDALQAAIKVKRSNPSAVLVSLHPGTVSTSLSKPFKGETIGRPAPVAAQEMLAMLDGLTAADTGSFVSYSGERLPW